MKSLRSVAVRAAVAMVSCALVVSCSANPGPAPIEEPGNNGNQDEAQEEIVPQSKRSEIAVGIDPVEAGFNPHLLKDDSVFIRTLSSLVLPSAFEGRRMNTDLLTSAREVPVPRAETASQPDAGATKAPVMALRYTINPAAQWSDGTPITVADFEYLAQELSQAAGAKNAALYREITSIESSDGGREVTVYLAHRIKNWQRLFADLLPSHHLRGMKFTEVLADSFPASGSHYMVGSIDRQRGVVVLNRNDRFWGRNPADIEVVDFVEIRSTSQALEQLGSQQLAFADLTPTQTSQQALSLIDGARLREETSDRTLMVGANANLPLAARQALLGLIDVRQLAELATGRVGAALPASSRAQRADEDVDVDQLTTLLNRPVRIGVDPSNGVAADAALNLKNMFVAAGLKARVVEQDSTTLFAKSIPTGAVDVYVGWQDGDVLARYQCGAEAEDDAEDDAEETQAAPTTVSGLKPQRPTAAPGAPAILGQNPTGYCTPETEKFIFEALAGEHGSQAVGKWALALEREQSLTLGIVRDERIQVAGSNLVGPSADIATWPQSMSSFKTWSIKEE
ncbi:ABC transporter substrate-binding protein [Corynebacterium sp. ZY180755]